MSGSSVLMNETMESIFEITSDSVIITRSPHESPNQGMRAAPKRIFHVMTFILSTKTGSVVLDDAVNVLASCMSSNVVTSDRQEKRTITAR